MAIHLETSVAEWEVKSLSPKGFFTGYASVFHVTDAQKDQMMPGAFQHTLRQWQQKKRLPFLLWQHDPQKPIGRWTHIEEDEKGLKVRGQLLLDIAQAREAHALMKEGILNSLSVGFFTIIAKKDARTRVRKIFQADLVEISVVTQGANPEAQLDSIKGWSCVR